MDIPLLTRIALRRIIRHWRLYLFVLVGISFASGLLAVIPSFSQAIAFHSLQRTIDVGHPIEKNLEIVGAAPALSSGLLGYLKEILGEIFLERLEIRTISLGVDNHNPVIPVDLGKRVPPDYIKVFSLDKLSKYTILVEGQWPEFDLPHTHEEIMRAMTKPPDIEAVIGWNAAQEIGVKIGDIIIDDSGRHFPVVGFVKPIDPKDDVWWGDLSIFNLERIPGLNEDTIFLSLVAHQNNLREYYLTHEASWRILLNHELFFPENIFSIEQTIIKFKSLIEIEGASLRSNLPNLLEKYRQDITITRIVVSYLSTQALIFILFGLYLLESLILEEAQSEFATLVGRGSNALQLVVVMGMEGLIIAAIAGLLTGPLIARIFIFIWSKLSGWQSIVMPGNTALALSMIGAGIGWLVLLFSTFSISRRNIVSWRKKQGRIDHKTIWQKYYIDVIMIIVSGIAYWQFSNKGSFLFQRLNDTDKVDPFLLISPSLFLFSISLALLRIYPYVLKIISWIISSARGIVLPISFIKLSRDPLKPTYIILLISTATSFTLFSSSYEYSLYLNQQEISHYLSGADIRISQNNLSLEEIAKVNGVITVSQVFRHETQLRTGRTITILGIDPYTLPKVAGYPNGMTNITIDTIANILLNEGFSEPVNHDGVALDPSGSNVDHPLPAIFSYSAIAPNKGIGDQQEISTLTRPIDFNIRGLIQNFPTGGNTYVLTDLASLGEVMDLERSEYYADFELWLSIDPEKYSEIISLPFIRDVLLSDAQQEMRSIRENAFTEGAIGAFKLNTFTISLLSILIFSILIYSSASNRDLEFGILQALGLSPPQLFKLLLTEGAVILIVGISMGTLIGIGLLFLMRPYLNVALLRSFPHMVVYEILYNWEQIAIRYGILTSSYLISLSLATWMLFRVQIYQVMRIGDE